MGPTCYAVGTGPLGLEKIGCVPDQMDNPWRYDPMSPFNNYHGNPMATFETDRTAGVASPPPDFPFTDRASTTMERSARCVRVTS